MTSVPMTTSSAAGAAETDGPFLQVEDLKVTFPTEDGPVTAVTGPSCVGKVTFRSSTWR